MAYIALPTRDSTFLLVANAAPRLPRSSAVTVSPPCSLVYASPVRILRVQGRRVFGASVSKPRGRWIFASAEGNVTVEEPAVSAGPAETAEGEEKPAEGAAAAEAPATTAAPAKKLGRSGTMPRQGGGVKREVTVTKEQLVPGAVFTGKVRAVQSYGAFVDIGAYTDGLVHISELSSDYVKEVNDVVSLGQEVSVTVVEVNEKAGRIALSMRDKESEAEQQASRSGGESGAGSGSQEDGSGKPRNRSKVAGRGAKANSKSSDDRKTTKLKKGQELKGTVKNIIRNGAFIEFVAEGEEGFLRGSEIRDGGENVAVDTMLTVGQEVTVRVLKIERGKAALTMKPQVDVTSINESINTNVGAGGASNPFATFFRSANLVPEAAASVDAGEETPAAEDVSAVQEAPVVGETPAAAEETPAVDETAAVAEAPAVEESADVGEAIAADEPAAVAVAPAAVEETPVVEESAAVSEAIAADEPAVVEETPAVEESADVAEAIAADEPAAAPEAPAAVEETPAVEESAAVAESVAAEEPDAVEETPSTEAAQAEAPSAEESSGESSQAEEPHALSLGEIAEGIGSAVHEVEKVAEAAAGTVRGH